MKKKTELLLKALLCFLAVDAASQSTFSSLQQVTPPSPEAISFVKQNFSNVNLYTGKLAYSIPLYTLSQNGLDFPITLNYTGGNGIKVEEVAGSVGLGWNLQHTGVITRSIRGRADDAYEGSYIGYIHLPGIDSTFQDVTRADIAIYDYNYSYGKYDPQPDLYYINAPGVSASFYINKYKKIVFVEKSDLRVEIIFNGYKITGFTVTALNGNIYLFNVAETTRSIALSAAPSEYTSYDVSSWYLSRVTNPYGKNLLTFEYFDGELNHTTQRIRSPYQYNRSNIHDFKEDESTYTLLYTKRPLLKKLAARTGVVEFVHSSGSRYDLANDRYLDSINVKNVDGQLIRSFNFDYSYFSSTGIVQDGEGSPTAEGNPALRLKLDKIETISGIDPSLKEVYAFHYNSSTLLPNRLSSFSMDHWGYYNGKSNTTWQARHRAKYFIPKDGLANVPLVQYDLFGTADREPAPFLSQACILKSVSTSNGATIQFQYEGHTANHPDLPNELSSSIIEYSLAEQKIYFTVDMIREPFAFVKIQAFADGPVEIEYIIQDSLETMPAIIDTLTAMNPSFTHKFPNGTYYVKARVIVAHPDPSFHYGPRLTKDTESVVINKPVGGLRIKQMQLTDPATTKSLTRKYYYNTAGSDEPTSLSTGTVGSVPRYGYQCVQGALDPNGNPTFIMQGYIRQLSSAYPLVSTNGSYTGYGKVTVVDNDASKSAYSFTSFHDFPECIDGYNGDALVAAGSEPDRNIDPYDPMNSKVYIDGAWYEAWPVAEPTERDFYRGKIKEEIHYRKDGTTYQKVSQRTNFYTHNFSFIGSQPIPPEGEDLPIESVIGMVVNLYVSEDDPEPTARNTSKSFFLHTGKYDLKKTIDTTYSYQNGVAKSLISEITYDYRHSPWFRDSLFHYQITKVSKTGSTFSDTTYYYYPYDRQFLNSDITAADTLHLFQLQKENRIDQPIIEKSITQDGVHLMTIKNSYSTYNAAQVYPSSIKIKNGTFRDENRFGFGQYDTLGNLLEQKKVDDLSTAYIWDYRLSHLVAEVINASQDEIAYTSFEADGKGNWSFSANPVVDITAPTGNNCLVVGSNITKSGLKPEGSYVVSYWKKDGDISVNGTTAQPGNAIGSWAYFEHKIVNPASGIITVSGNGTIDELRLYPSLAQMKSYTYEPLVGVTSYCDANNQISYFIYDGFGRLHAIKDQNRDIVKKYQHHLYNQE